LGFIRVWPIALFGSVAVLWVGWALAFGTVFSLRLALPLDLLFGRLVGCRSLSVLGLVSALLEAIACRGFPVGFGLRAAATGLRWSVANLPLF
jgi:hypothetical protein